MLSLFTMGITCLFVVVGVRVPGSGTTGLTSEDEVEEELRIVPLGVCSLLSVHTRITT